MKVIAVVFLIVTIICAYMAVFHASADEVEYFIICNPESYVNVRRAPRKGSDETGQVYCGDRVISDGKTKNGYLHCVDLSTEYGEGWIHLGYVVDNEPMIVDGYATVTAGGRVAARRWVNGKRSSWLKDGTRIRVLVVSAEWTLTVRGFVRTEYLEAD